MEYLEALKKVQAMKIKENLMAIRLNYDCTLILPWKDGLAFMSTLGNAEQLTDKYNDQPRITAFDQSAISVTVLPAAGYQRIKVAALLGVKPEEVKQYETVE